LTSGIQFATNVLDRKAQIMISLILLALSSSLFAGEIETIRGFYTDPDGISFQVSSSGCTDKEDFQVQKSNCNPPQLALVRKKPDLCKAYIPYGVFVQYSWQELGFSKGTQFKIANLVEEIEVK
jgi:hypothetical protein